MHFRFGRNDRGRVTVKEAGDGSDNQYFAISQFLEQHTGDYLAKYVDQVRHYQDALKDRDEWGMSGNLMAFSLTHDGVEIYNLFADDQDVPMTHEEFIELVGTYVQELEDANDPRSATNARKLRVQPTQDDA